MSTTIDADAAARLRDRIPYTRDSQHKAQQPDKFSFPLYKPEFNVGWSQSLGGVYDPSQFPGEGKYWTIHNKRYDMTKFINNHPGGSRMILLGQGRNCTELFETYHAMAANPTYPVKLLEKYYVEDAKPGDLDYYDDFDWEKTPFYDELKVRVRGYFKKKGISHKYDAFHWTVSILSTIMAYYCVYAFFQGKIWAPVALGFFYWLGPSPYVHDGGHFSISAEPWVNDLFGRIGFGFSSQSTWDLGHTVGHHVRTNMVGFDPDYAIPLLRHSTDFEYHPAYKNVLIRLIVRSCMITFSGAVIRDIQAVKENRKASIHFGPFMSTTIYRVRHYAGRFFLIACMFLIPFYLFSLPKALYFVLTPWILHAQMYYWVSQVSHIVTTTCHGFKKTKEKVEFAIHQVNECHDYSQESTFWQIMCHGLNNQTIHHVFPTVATCHYPAIYPIFKQTCKDFNVEYKESANLWEASKKHWEHICNLNLDDSFDHLH